MSKIVVLSGAGLSAESGIATFRDKNGLWENHKIDEVANYMTWKQNFNLVHRFYNERRSAMASVEPNAAHYLYAELATKYAGRYVHLTQNIDNLLERAGHPKDESSTSPLFHLHGFLTEMKCEACGHIWDIGYTEFDAGNHRCPVCPSRNGIKPNVVFFYENSPMYTFMHRAIRDLTKDDVVIVTGTMGQVLPITALFYDAPGYKILNNLEPSVDIDGSIFDECLYMPATQAAPLIRKAVEEKMGG
jgi:NAD-dependent deacetylase